MGTLLHFRTLALHQSLIMDIMIHGSGCSSLCGGGAGSGCVWCKFFATTWPLLCIYTNHKGDNRKASLTLWPDCCFSVFFKFLIILESPENKLERTVLFTILICTEPHGAGGTLKSSFFLSRISSVFTPQTAEAGGNVLVYPDSLWSDGHDGPANRFFSHLTPSIYHAVFFRRTCSSWYWCLSQMSPYWGRTP